MDENQAPAGPRADPFQRVLRPDGAWEPVGGLRLAHVQTGEAFGRLSLPPGEDSGAWLNLVEALADLDSARLVPPRAVIDGGAGLLYAQPEAVGGSFAHLLEEQGSADQTETMRMAADLCAALADLHSCGVVLGRLSLQDVVCGPDGGWMLLISPASGARVAGQQELTPLSRADLVLLATAVVTVLTGRRPSAHRRRPSLLSTHPQLDPAAAEALERLLGEAAAEPLDDRPGPLRDGPGSRPGALSAADLALILRPDHGPAAPAVDARSDPAQDESTEVLPVLRQDRADDGWAAVAADDAAAIAEGAAATPDHAALSAERVAATPDHARVVAEGAASTPGAAAAWRAETGRPPRARVGSAQRGTPRPPARVRGGRLAGLRRLGAPRQPAPPEARRTRSVLIGAAVMVIAAGALAGWQLVPEPAGEGEPAASLAQGSAVPGPMPSGAPSAVPLPPGASPSQPPASGTPSGPAPSGSDTPAPVSGAGGDRASAVSARHSPEYAAAALIRRRAEALRTGDRELLESVYAPGAADLVDDLATLDQAAGTGAFADLEMTLAGAEPLTGSQDGPAQGSEGDQDTPAAAGTGRTAVVAGTVQAAGTDLDPEQEGVSTLSQDLEIRLAAGEPEGWRIVEVTPR